MTIQQRFVVVAHPQANGQVEITDRIVLDVIKKRLEGSKRKWVKELDTVLWTNRTIPRTAIGEMSFSLFYRSEAVIPAKIIFDSPRIEAYKEGANAIARREDLDLVELRRDVTQIRAKKYKSQIRARYNRKLNTREFEGGDLVLKRVDALKPLTKWEANKERSLIVTEVLKGCLSSG